MDQHKSLIIRILVAGAMVYAGWNFMVRPAHTKLDLLKSSRATQEHLIVEAGLDFELRQQATEETHKVVHAAGARVLDMLASSKDEPVTREQINTIARTYGVDVNRIEPLRVMEFSNNQTPKNTMRSPEANLSESKKGVKFLGEGLRVELDGGFANIAGFLHELNASAPTIKMESFRMVSSGNGNGRMIAQFMKFDLVEAPIGREHDHTQTADAGGQHGIE